MNTYLQRYLGIDEQREYRQPAGLPSLRTLERDYIRFLLDATSRNMTEVARILSISRSSLYHKLRKYSITE